MRDILWHSFLDLFFPAHCVNCGKIIKLPGKIFLCQDCFSGIKFLQNPVCRKCGKPGCIDLCSECRKTDPLYTMARAAALYEGVLRTCIHNFKYRHQMYLVKTLGNILTGALKEFTELSGFNIIVPVPLYSKRKRERGFNQSLLLANEIGKLYCSEISVGNLTRNRPAVPQTELSRSERIKNVRGIFSVKDESKFRGKNILLIDDVLTTGSTVNECSRVLLEAGSAGISVMTVARGQ